MNFLALFCIVFANSFANSFEYTRDALFDQLLDLPGLNWKPVFNQFSGYLNLEGTEKYIHYWLVESAEDPINSPLVFWTNGGPGCSGLIGFMTEQGPFRPDADGNLVANPYAWNKIANMVFLEQPVGVGFSYSNNDDDYKIGDDQAAQDNLATILAFLQKFPHFNQSALYITSESYGGHYMPTWADAIIQYNDAQEYSQEKLNFKGFAVGNPYTDYYSGVGAQMETYWGKQLIPKPSWDEYLKNGCTDPSTLINSTLCDLFIIRYSQIIGNLNPYALDYPVCLSSQQQRMMQFIYEGIGNNRYLHSFSINDYEPCEDNYAANYLNRDEVKSAIHVHSDIVWEECSRTTKYRLADKMIPMQHYYTKILNSKSHPDLRVLIYSGDDDGVCGTIGTQRWIYDLGFPVESLWKTWYNNEGQTAGYITKFATPFVRENRLHFVTVHFAGHEVPTYKPSEALQLFEMYINNKI